MFQRQIGGGGYPGVASYVFSRTLKGLLEGGATLVSDDADEFVRELKRRDQKDICLMGGGELARSQFEAGLIDEVGLNIHPVLLGSDIPVFHTPSASSTWSCGSAGRSRTAACWSRTG